MFYFLKTWNRWYFLRLSLLGPDVTHTFGPLFHSVYTPKKFFLAGPSWVTFLDSKSGCQMAPGCANSSVPFREKNKVFQLWVLAPALVSTPSLLGSPRLWIEIWHFALFNLVLCMYTWGSWRGGVFGILNLAGNIWNEGNALNMIEMTLSLSNVRLFATGGHSEAMVPDKQHGQHLWTTQPVGNADSQAPPWAYWIRLCTLTRLPDGSDTC